MKKWLIGCLTVLAMVCLIPGIALNAKAESLYCRYCGKFTDCEILGYKKFDSDFHTLHIKCKSCSKENDVIDSKYSERTDDGKTPTCITGKICEKCGAEYGVLGHDWGAWTPNYASNGTHTRRCTRCDKEETESCSGGTATCSAKAVCEVCGGKYGKKDPKNHAFVYHQAKPATCKEIGWDAYRTCSRCDYTDYVELPALNHDFVHHDAKAPTCTEIGWNAYDTCNNCNYTTYVEQPALNHAFEYYKAKDPTCTEPGCDAYETCSRCDYTTYVERPALKHDLRQRVIKAPTCTEIGWAYETCSRCDYFASPVLPALNHDLKQYAAKAPTCTEKGWNAYETCSRCDYTTYTELTALNHDLEQHAAQAPTCTEPGWNAYSTCKNCDYNTYQELPALNHDLVQHDAQAATCTEKGWDAYDTCSRLGCNYTTYQEIPALNHDLVQHEAKAPTCTEKGWNTYETCSRCDHTTYAELPALNHDYQAVTVDPTCETDGYTVFTCSRCKDSYTADPTDKLGHQFGAWSPNGTGSQSAGCLRQGCVHTGSTDCRKFTFRTAEGETLTFCPVCGQAENAAQLEKIDAATAWTISGSLSAEDVTARTNGEYLSVAFETAGSLTQPTGLVRLALPAGLLEGKKLVRIAPDGTQTEMPFEAKNGKLIFTLDFANSELPVMLFRLLPQTAAL